VLWIESTVVLWIESMVVLWIESMVVLWIESMVVLWIPGCILHIVASTTTRTVGSPMDLTGSNWLSSLIFFIFCQFRRAIEKKKQIVIIKDDSFPPMLPGKFPKDAKPIEKQVRRCSKCKN
jgi:hypothetical protein